MMRLCSVSVLAVAGPFVAQDVSALRVNVVGVEVDSQQKQLNPKFNQDVSALLTADAVEKCKEHVDAFFKFDDDRERLLEEDARWMREKLMLLERKKQMVNPVLFPEVFPAVHVAQLNELDAWKQCMLGTVDNDEEIRWPRLSALHGRLGAWLTAGGVHGKRARNIVRESFRVGVLNTFAEEKQRVIEAAKPDISRRAALIERHNAILECERRKEGESRYSFSYTYATRERLQAQFDQVMDEAQGNARPYLKQCEAIVRINARM